MKNYFYYKLMCFNYKASLLSLTIGMISGLLLIMNKPEKRAIGIFILFYTLVQLLEAIMYNYGNNTPEIYSKLLLINLGLQGLVFFLSLNYIYKIPRIYLYLSLFISLYIVLETMQNDFKKININPTINWNFMNLNVSIFLIIMYFLMFYWLYYNKELRQVNTNSQLVENFGKLLFATCMISYMLPKTNANHSSIWCISSALIAPITLFL